MALWVAALTLCGVGMATAPTMEMRESSQKAIHWVCTAFGVSNLGYKGPQHTPFQGVGQGNSAGPTTWALTSALLLSIVAIQGFGVNL